MISGLPYLARASFKASTQKLASSVFDNRQDSTLRVAQSTPLMVCKQTTAGQRIATR